jgi:hypothetical protein
MKIKELKQRLKELALSIRQTKHMYKDCQRGKVKWADYYEFCKTQPGGDYRHMHIAYCLLRGKKYEQVENKVKEGNEPNWALIEVIMNQYREVDPILCSEVMGG